MKSLQRRSPRRAALIAVVMLGLAVAAMTAATAPAASVATVKITVLVDNSTVTDSTARPLVAAFQKANPHIKIQLDLRPGGTDGDNFVKTKLATGSMDDVFEYNSGALFQQINPTKTLLPLNGQSFMKKVSKPFWSVVSVRKTIYGVPFQSSFAGGILYNIPIYKKLGLSVPRTWSQFIANSLKIKAAGYTAVEQTYGDTWTSQLLFLGDYANVAAHEPGFAARYTTNQPSGKFATDKLAGEGFDYLAQVHSLGLENSDYASAKLDDGLKAVANGSAAQYPMLTAVAGSLLTDAPNNINDVGFFAQPGQTAKPNPATMWMPAAWYVPKTTKGAKLAAVMKFLAFNTTTTSCNIQSKASPPTGPYMIVGCKLPTNVPKMTKDVQPYVDKNQASPALEFLSPVKGPNLEKITVAVGSGITSATEGRAQYDADVKQEAQQLGLPGW